jgi:hypothetical protein
MIDHGPQASIADRLAVHGAHVRNFVPHDEIDGGLILRFIGHGAKAAVRRLSGSYRRFLAE